MYGPRKSRGGRVSRRERGHTLRYRSPLLAAQQRIEHPSDLEGAGVLEVLGLEDDLSGQLGADTVVSEHRRAHDPVGQPPRGRLDFLALHKVHGRNLRFRLGTAKGSGVMSGSSPGWGRRNPQYHP